MAMYTGVTQAFLQNTAWDKAMSISRQLQTQNVLSRFVRDQKKGIYFMLQMDSTKSRDLLTSLLCGENTSENQRIWNVLQRFVILDARRGENLLESHQLKSLLLCLCKCYWLGGGVTEQHRFRNAGFPSPFAITLGVMEQEIFPEPEHGPSFPAYRSISGSNGMAYLGRCKMERGLWQNMLFHFYLHPVLKWTAYQGRLREAWGIWQNLPLHSLPNGMAYSEVNACCISLVTIRAVRLFRRLVFVHVLSWASHTCQLK